MTSSFIEYFLCPPESANFIRPTARGAAPGFFRFGTATCFGQCEGMVRPTPADHLSDARQLVVRNGCGVRLPFDPGEALDNLRTERYLGRNHASFASSMIREAYYALRPLLPVSTRKYFQRSRLRGRRQATFPAWPIEDSVDILARELMSCLAEATPDARVPFIWFWPEGFESCLVMTHDVEHEAGRAFCSEMMSIDASYGIRSSFQIVPEERYRVTSAYLDEICGRGFELNVHDLNHRCDLFHDRGIFSRSAPKINDYAREWGARGFRSAAMYRNPDWIRELQFSYDMSFPTAAHLEPQAGGCCTVMPYFLGDLVELPLTMTQDYTLLHILQDSSIDLWKQEIEMLRQRNAFMSFIVHPDYVMSGDGRRLYIELLEHLAILRQLGAIWFAQPGEVADWWRDRSCMNIVNEAGQFRIVGPRAQYARLAFARRSKEGLCLQIEKGNSAVAR
jgi:hypothetical protein